MIQKREIFPRVPLYYSVPMLAICIVAFLILILIFRVEYPVLLLQVPTIPANAINVSSCGNLTQNNAYYVLNQSILSSLNDDCFIITGDNIILNGQSRHLIKGTGGYAGVRIEGKNVTAQYLNLTSFGVGILSIYTNNSIINNNFINDSNGGITLSSSIGSRVLQNEMHNTQSGGIYLVYSNNSFVSGNVVLGGELFGSYSLGGFTVFYSDSNRFANNIVNATQISLRLDESNSNSFSNMILDSPTVYGVLSTGTGSNNFSDINLSNSANSAIFARLSANQSILLNNVKTVNTNSSYYDLDLGSYNFSAIPTFAHIKDSSFASYRINQTQVTISKRGIGKINFTQALIDSGSNLADDIRLGFNYAEVNSASKPGLNKNATITFENLPTNLVSPLMYRNGAPCPVAMCVNHTSMNAGNVSFSVMGWTNYSIGSVTFTSQSLTINEPDPNEQYTTAAFPVTFRVILSTVNGSVKFSLNNGATNTTMVNDSTGVEFEYVQNSLSVGNYTFIAFANFTNGTRIKDSVNFSVVNTTGSTTATGSGSNSGSGSGSGSGTSSSGTTAGTTGNGTTSGGLTTGSGFGTTSGTGSTQTLTGSQSKSTALRSMIFWLLIAVVSIMIIILSILIFKAIMHRRDALSSTTQSNQSNSGGLISNLR